MERKKAVTHIGRPTFIDKRTSIIQPDRTLDKNAEKRSHGVKVKKKRKTYCVRGRTARDEHTVYIPKHTHTR